MNYEQEAEFMEWCELISSAFFVVALFSVVVILILSANGQL